MSNYIYTNEGLVNVDELTHYGIPGMKWGKRKSSYTYAYGQTPKSGYQKAMRSLGGTKFAKKAIANSKLSGSQKKKALEEQAVLADEKAYNKAKRKAAKTGGTMTYDIATKKYSVDVSTDGSKKRAAEKANYKASKAKNKSKAELKAYANEIYKSGLPGSARDDQAGGRSTNLHAQLVSKKGKTYADQVLKKAQSKSIRRMIAGGTLAIGATIVGTYVSVSR